MLDVSKDLWSFISTILDLSLKKNLKASATFYICTILYIETLVHFKRLGSRHIHKEIEIY